VHRRGVTAFPTLQLGALKGDTTMLDAIWQDISRDARRRFAEDTWEALIRVAKTEPNAAQVLGSLCRRLEIRQRAIASGPNSHAVHLYVRHFDRVLSLGQGAVALAYLDGKRVPQLQALHAALGHDKHAGPSDQPAVTAAQCLAAFAQLSKQFGEEDARLLFATVALHGFESWRQPIRSVLLELPPVEIDSASPSNDSRSLSSTPTIAELDAVATQSIPSLRRPDNLMIDAVVKRFSEYDVEEAVSLSRELIAEFRDLDSARVESFFHVGFIDALAGDPRAIRGAEVNATRKCWYLAGYFQGYCRGADLSACLAMLSEIREEVDRLGDDVRECGALPYIIHLGMNLFDSADRPSDVAQLVAECHPLDGQGIMIGLRIVGRLLASGQLDAAREVLASVPTIGLASLPRDATVDLLFLHRRCHATILRLGGRLQEAEDVYRAIWEEATSMPQRAVALDGFALCTAGIRDLAGLAITQNNGDSLARASIRIRDLLAANPSLRPGPRSMLVWALSEIVSGAQGDRAGPVAEQLREARNRFDRRGLTVEAHDRVLRRLDAYAGMLDLRAGLDDRAEGAAQSIATMLGEDTADCLPPITLCAEALQNAMICGAPSSERIAAEIAARFGSASLDELPHTDIGRQSPAVAKIIAQYLNDSTSAIAPARRFEVATCLLAGMLEFRGMLDRETARIVYESMLRAGSSDSETAKMIAEFISARRNALLKVLVEDEIDEHYTQACLRCGDIAGAAAAIVRRMHSALSAANIGQLRMLATQADELGAGDQVPEPMRRRLALAEIAENPPTGRQGQGSDGQQDGPAAEELVVQYYAFGSGSRPVLDFGDTKYERDRDGGDRYLAALRDLPTRFSTGQGSRIAKLAGRAVSIPGSSAVDLWEYRAVQMQGGWVRILFARVGSRLVLLHAFSKHQNQIAEEDCETAEQRLKDHLR
jgi:hypothetical protein